MYRESKYKRVTALEIRERELRQPNVVNKKALDKFRENPYQLKYKEMMNGGGGSE